MLCSQFHIAFTIRLAHGTFRLSCFAYVVFIVLQLRLTELFNLKNAVNQFGHAVKSENNNTKHYRTKQNAGVANELN